MNIVTKLTDTLVKVQGKVDSANAAQFEEELLSAVSGQNLTIDAEALTYISSAGLRVLLKVKKALAGQLVMENVNAGVYDILDMTGFTQILTVKKAYRQISVEGLTEIGHGQNGHVYRMDADTIVKVFRPGIDFSMVQNEITRSKTAFLHGIPTAISYDVVKVGDCFGVVYEMLNAKDLAYCMKEDPAHLEDYIRLFASAVRQMHTMEVSPAQFTPCRTVTLGALPYTKGRIFNDVEYEKIKAILENIPDRTTFIHGDCHAGNVMLQGNDLMLIDLSCAGSGHPIFDLMSMYLSAACYQIHEKVSLVKEDKRVVTEYMTLLERDREKFQEGVEKGIEQGIEQGIEKGIEQAKLEVASALLDVLEDDMIALKTGLSIDQVRNLRKQAEEKH